MRNTTPELLTHCQAATFASALSSRPYGLVDDAALVVEDGRIAWLGPLADLPQPYNEIPRRDLKGQLVTPALIDCHTHLVFGGNRAHEFELRLNGASYEEISRAGGGIRSTVTATREASQADLLEAALPRIDRLVNEGVGTIEIKSGYGLDLDTERRMLSVAREIARIREVRVRTTFLGAHTMPPEFADADEYIQFVAYKVLPTLAQEGLVDAVDAFCEGIAFSPSQVAILFDAARDLALPVKLHAEQLSDLKGARLAASYGALSVDHLEYLADEDTNALAAAGSVAVLLPGAFYFLRETKQPPLAALRAAGVPVALATDLNPGSSPLASLLLAVNMGCTLFRLTPEEALAGVTRNAAMALGLASELGTLEVGKRAELAVWAVTEPAELAYHIGANPLVERLLA
jgi:imidazolonepropionase